MGYVVLLPIVEKKGCLSAHAVCHGLFIVRYQTQPCSPSTLSFAGFQPAVVQNSQRWNIPIATKYRPSWGRAHVQVALPSERSKG